MSFDACMARTWPGITDKEAFCASMDRGDLGKRGTEPCETFANLEIVKINSEQRIATGWVSVVEDADGNPIVDSDGHLIPIEELEKAVHAAFAESSGSGKGADLHEQQAVIDVLESMVVTAEKREKLDFGKGPSGWVATFRVNDESVWDMVKSGERPELSLRGSGRGVPLQKQWTTLSKSETPILITDIKLNKLEWFSTVDKGASGDEKHRPRIVLWKRADLKKQETDPMTLEEILAKLSDEEKAVVMQALQDAAKPAEPAPAPAAPMPIAQRADVPDDVKVELEKREAEAKKAEDERIEMQKRLETLENESRTVEIRKRVETEMQFVPGDAAELVEIIKAARKVDGDTAAKLEDRLVQISKAMRESPLLKVMGTGASDINDDDPEVELQKRADELRKADPKMSLVAARQQVLAEVPDLYERMVKAG